jgi:hypothetical protein
MKKFTKGELISVILTLIFITGITSFNLVKSLRRARDAQRKVDLGIISNALNDFQADYGFFPKSDNGRVVICKNEKFEEVRKQLSELQELDFDVLYEGLKSCTWGVDVFNDVFDDKEKPYMTTFPSDPKTSQGYTYYYISNGNRYQLYTYLEGEEDEVGYDGKIVGRSLPCGKEKYCSYGKTYGETPLDRSIEEYEKEILLMQTTGNK